MISNIHFTAQSYLSTCEERTQITTISSIQILFDITYEWITHNIIKQLNDDVFPKEDVTINILL